jgi:selT/selW/selH-like putative selenoprotein
LREALKVESELIAGGVGIFDVLVDGKRVYSKFETGRFPEPGEVVGLIGE